MAARNLAPTKSNLLNLRQELGFAKQGYELLDQKRNILIIELLGLVDQATDFESQVGRALERAFTSLQEAVLAGGRLQMLHLGNAVHIDSSIEVAHRKVMGVRLPVVHTEFTDHAPYFSPYDGSFWVNVAIRDFQAALNAMGRLAELKVSIVRLASEVRKTIRKVNALDKIAIPELEDTVKSMQDRLEENERDMFVLMKMVKSRLERKER